MIRKALPLLTLAAVFAACSGPEEADFRDRTGPSVLEVTPADGETGIAVDTEILVKFSESILVRKKVSRSQVEEFDFGGFVATGPDGAPVAGFITFNNDSLTFRPANGLAYSTKYTFSVNDRVKDLFGNPAKPYAWSFETEADRVAPTQPYNLIYPSITNQASVTIEGSMDPESSLIVNGKSALSHPENGLFTLTVSVAEGTNAFTFSAIDDAGNESEPVQIDILRDSTPPASLATCGSAGLQWHAGMRSGCWDPPATVVWNKPSLPMGATWTPGPSESAVFTLGDQGAPACSTARCEYAGFDTTLLGSGTVKLRAYTTDQAGNQSVAFERDFRYDAVPPALSLTSSLPVIFAAGKLGLAATTTTQTAGTLTFAKEAGARYFASVDGAAAGACTDAATSCTLSYAALADGEHRFAVTATDAAGNETRLTKFVTVDTRAPRVFMLPGTGATPSPTPTIHVFADEAVTTGTLQLSAQTLVPAADPASRRRHWTFTPTALAGAETAVVAVYDAAGNRTIASTSFTVTNVYATPPTAYAGFTTGGTARGGQLTLGGLTAALTLAAVDDGGAAGTYAYDVTTGASLALTLDALSQAKGTVYAYDDNGGVAALALLPDDPWAHGAPAVSAEVVDDRSSLYGPAFATVLPTPGGFAFFSDTGYAFWFDGAGGRPEGDRLDFMAGCNMGIGHPFPALYPLASPWALGGKPCESLGAGVSVVKLDPAALAAGTVTPLWAPPDPGDDNFGLAVTGAFFFGNADQQVAVGAPNGAGRLYLYAATTATAPTYRLSGDESKNGRFGDSAAFAARHHGGKTVLGITAPDEPAVYFFDEGIYANQAVDPMGLYRVRMALPNVDTCIAGSHGRHEIVNVGNVDGDAAGSDDLVVATWADNCLYNAPASQYQVVIHLYLGGQGAAGADPIVVPQTYQKGFGGGRPRIVPLGDLNGDGRADFGFIDSTGGALARIFYGAASGRPEGRLIYPTGDMPAGWWVLGGASDVDGDALADLILSVRGGVSQPLTILSRP